MSLDLSSDYFSLFGLPVSYSIDSGFLMQQYRALQLKVHPDRFVNGTDLERRLSLQYSTHINEALQVLKNPLQRARYMLELKGVQWDDERQTLSDTSFLMQQMELRESLSEVREQQDPLDAIAVILTEVADLIRSYSQQLQSFLESSVESDLDKAKDQVRKMQFLSKMLSEAESLEAELEDEL